MTREEAIDTVRNIYQTDKEKEALATLIPELAESDEERIRKEIISALKFANGGGVYDKHIDYLERQKEQKSVEWSEEDEAKKERLISIVKRALQGNKYPFLNNDGATELIAWLKSLNLKKRNEDIAKLCSNEWSEEDERMLSRCIKSIESSKQFADSGTFKAAKDKEIAWLKAFPLNLKKKNEDVAKLRSNEWSKEDEDFINMLILHFNYLIDKGGDSVETYKSYIEKIKSLRPQPNTQWSEEDEENISTIIEVIRGRVGLSESRKQYYENFLKSLRPKPHTVSIKDATKFGNLEYERGVKDGIQYSEDHRWKPSKEQMDALKEASASWMNREMGNSELLESLYNSFKNYYKL